MKKLLLTNNYYSSSSSQELPWRESDSSAFLVPEPTPSAESPDAAIMVCNCTLTRVITGCTYCFLVFILWFSFLLRYLMMTFFPFLINKPLAGCATFWPCRLYHWPSPCWVVTASMPVASSAKIMLTPREPGPAGVN